MSRCGPMPAPEDRATACAWDGDRCRAAGAAARPSTPGIRLADRRGIGPLAAAAAVGGVAARALALRPAAAVHHDMAAFAPAARTRAAAQRLAATALAAIAAACGDPHAPTAPAPVRVFAASSLAQPFAAIVEAEAAAGEPRAELSFAGSAQLALQLQQGAAACVFASADPVTMQKVVAAGLTVGEPVVFARNRLAIVVPAGNPKGVRGLADLARRDLVVLLGAPDVPAGRYARQALQRAGVAVAAASDEPSVRAIVGKVQAGEADAGVVYRTDCTVAGVAAVPLDPAHDVVAELLAVPLASAVDGERAAAFVASLRADAGRATLARFGFELP